MPVHNNCCHDVSRWHCLPFKHGRNLSISPISFFLLISPSLSHICFCVCHSLLILLNHLLSFPPSLVSQPRSVWKIQQQTSACVLKSLVLSDLIKASLSLTEHTERCRMRPFAPVQREERTGQFGKPLSSCGEFPLQESSLLSQIYFMLAFI